MNKTMSKSQLSIDPKVLEQAAIWHARITNEDIQGYEWGRFAEWLEADVIHVAAYDQIEDTDTLVADMSAEIEAVYDLNAEKTMPGAQYPQAAQVSGGWCRVCAANGYYMPVLALSFML